MIICNNGEQEWCWFHNSWVITNASAIAVVLRGGFSSGGKEFDETRRSLLVNDLGITPPVGVTMLTMIFFSISYFFSYISSFCILNSIMDVLFVFHLSRFLGLNHIYYLELSGIAVINSTARLMRKSSKKLVCFP